MSGAMCAAALCVCRPLATWLFPLREGFFLPQLHQGSSLREASSNLLSMNMGDGGAFGIELLNSILNARQSAYQGTPFECHDDIPQARSLLATWRAEG